MRNHFTIGFKFRDEDYTAFVSTLVTTAFIFYKVIPNDEGLQEEFGSFLNYSQDILQIEPIKTGNAFPTILDWVLIDELNKI